MEEDIPEGEYAPEFYPPDVTKAIADLKRQALDVLFPLPSQTNERIPLITRLRGREPDINILVGAAVEYECLKALEEGRLPASIDPIEFFKEFSVSLQGRGRKEAVEIARATRAPHDGGMLGRFKRWRENR